MLDYSPAKNLLAERTILVTGAGDGIGRAVSQALASHGATVVLLGRTLAKLEAVYDQIEAAGGVQPAIYPLNLEGATEHDYLEMADKLEAEFGSLEGLLHNAAQLRLLSRIDDYDAQTWFQVLQTNLNGPFLLTQACLPLLRKAKDASLLFTSDHVGRKAKAFWGAYTVSKFGIEGLMQVIAEELGTENHIRVNSFAPGPTRTRLRAIAYPGEDPGSLKPPEQLTAYYLWLLGPDSAGTTGAALDESSEVFRNMRSVKG
ncbi:MAG: YciK family oxidoreductase [Chromatiaceae bacterium]|nr:YciK family oxidoreductase [Gammaproteobacteria bacterium]MCP5445477.1 YciK family oxidoreductase [Chromatiaceae bacterium]MCB1860721.1 YciK family oxidoreductase [Gammaproteobacteria bacterium]MCB1874017.1 YciK family oxidoreductase [Gammaproteobacteria bacterium]MCB1879998.1 YciK family oxidoreductase [Gammaproteobacteria bacterium]